MKRWQMAWWKMLVGLVLISVLLTSSISAQKLDYGSLESFVEVHGMIVQEYYDFGKDGENKGIPTFDSRYAYLFIQCSLRENLKGVMEWKIDHGGEKIGIDRCYLDWKLHRLIGFRAGKLFYLPIMYDAQDFRPSGNKLVSSPLPSLFAIEVMFRDNGVEAYGEQPIHGMRIRYQAAISNGSMLNRVIVNPDGTSSFEESGRDGNPKKAIATSLSLLPIKELELVGSYYHNSAQMIAETKTVTPSGIPGVDVVVTTQIDLGEMETAIRAVSAVLSLNRFNTRSWYLNGSVDAKSFHKADLSGYMGEVAYRILEKKYVNYLELVGRYTVFDFDVSKISGLYPNMSTVTSDLGVGVSPYEHFRIKAQYEWVEEKKGPKKENDGIMLQAVLDF